MASSGFSAWSNLSVCSYLEIVATARGVDELDNTYDRTEHSYNK
ncbi:MAG: hypothetical protein WCC65_12490 [Pseudonocardiaceae bacterium]